MSTDQLDLVVSPIKRADDLRMPEVEALFASAFPPEERKPHSFLGDAVRREDYHLLAASVGQSFVGFAIVYESKFGFALLEYMAVAEEERGSGYGAELFRATQRLLERPLVLEVEAPVDPAMAELQARRVNFYRRLGCVAIPNLIYRMPKVGAGDPPPMWLMLSGYPHKFMATAELRKWMLDWFANVYDRPDDNSVIDEMIASLPRQIVL